MDLRTKKAILSSIPEDIAKELLLPCSVNLENVGSVFFMSQVPFIPLEKLGDLVFKLSAKHHLEISLVSLDTHHFAGNFIQAKALFEGCGGQYRQIRYQDGAYQRIIGLWEGSIYNHDQWNDPLFNPVKVLKMVAPLEKEDVINALF